LRSRGRLALACALAAAVASTGATAEDAAVEVTAAEVDRLLERLVSATAAVHDYVCTFTKEERVGAELQPMDTILLKQRREPRCAYLKWIGGEDRGREAIYCPPKYGTEFKVHEGSGIASWMTLSLDPLGRVAMDGERHPITEAGIFFTVEGLARRLRADRSRLRFERGKRPECLVATQIAPSGHYAHRTVICLDREHSLPASLEVFDAGGQLLERYVYSDYRLDVGLTDRDFDVGNPDYHF
jgi:outer membrane lipoprotein-sorting protein